MPNRINVTVLNATSLDIINTIRANASAEYQNLVPEIKSYKELPAVGEAIMGYPALSNQFISSLVNRIAIVRVKSATFNNSFAMLKKGYLAFGETVEEVFVSICKAREFNPEKAAAREFKRSLPDVRTAFHAINWRVQYPITVQNEDLRMAFLSENGVTDLVAKIVNSVYQAAEYDEYLLFKYLLIKAISGGKMYPVSFDASVMENAAKKFRGMSNLLTFMKSEFNAAGVTTTTPKADQYIFMDAQFNADYDVDVLASAFNMDKADFMGRLVLVDDFTTFDNDRFEEIRANSDMIEEVTAEELALMQNVKAVLCDGEWFQVYDNLMSMTEVNVTSGLYWNYNLHTWKTVSSSPFSNAVVFVDGAAGIAPPATLTVNVDGVVTSDTATVITLAVKKVATGMPDSNVQFVQTEELVTAGIAVQRYGALMIPADKAGTEITLKATINGVGYTAAAPITGTTEVGTTVTMNKDA